MSKSLSLEEVKARLMAACRAVEDNQDRLTKADQAIGDGDHGVGMARGFRAAREALETKPAATVKDLFKTAGMAVMSKSGGASGAVFGTFLMSAGDKLAATNLDSPSYAEALKNGFSAVQARGGARPGAKTMLDALAPAIDGAAGADSIEQALSKAAEGAVRGVEATKGMIATTGKAKALGARSLGHVDPGALTLSILLGALAGPAV